MDEQTLMKDAEFYLIGDIHGDFKPIRRVQQALNTQPKFYDRANFLICLGDFGANFFGNHRDEEFKAKISRYHFIYFVIRGNHEERPSLVAARHPDQWHMEEHFGGLVYVENNFPNIWYALDTPAVYTINGYSVLTLGGAYSVDKYVRLENGWSWFPEEQMSDSEMDFARALIKQYPSIDLVLSHTCPIMYEPTDLFLSCVDQSIVNKTMERFLGEVEYTLDYKRWCFGHFHKFREYPITDGRRRVMLFQEVITLNDLMTTSLDKSLTII